MRRAVIIYWSKTGNTEKVAFATQDGLENAGVNVTIRRLNEAEDLDFYDYDLICIGSPSYQWHPPRPLVDFLMEKFNHYRRLGRVKLGAPKLAGKKLLVFCTYSGPHTGLNEAIPVGKYIGQFFEHLGFEVIDEWYVLSEFHGSNKNSTMGRMGDIRGKPTIEDLDKIKIKASKIAHRL
jgi:flavorubredoxin